MNQTFPPASKLIISRHPKRTSPTQIPSPQNEHSANNSTASSNQMTLEEKENAYQVARNRIFQNEEGSEVFDETELSKIENERQKSSKHTPRFQSLRPRPRANQQQTYSHPENTYAMPYYDPSMVANDPQYSQMNYPLTSDQQYYQMSLYKDHSTGLTYYVPYSGMIPSPSDQYVNYDNYTNGPTSGQPDPYGNYPESYPNPYAYYPENQTAQYPNYHPGYQYPNYPDYIQHDGQLHSNRGSSPPGEQTLNDFKNQGVPSPTQSNSPTKFKNETQRTTSPRTTSPTETKSVSKYPNPNGSATKQPNESKTYSHPPVQTLPSHLPNESSRIDTKRTETSSKNSNPSTEVKQTKPINELKPINEPKPKNESKPTNDPNPVTPFSFENPKLHPTILFGTISFPIIYLFDTPNSKIKLSLKMKQKMKHQTREIKNK